MILHRAFSAFAAIASTMAITATFAGACAQTAGPGEPAEPVREAQDELSELSIERTIPLRFIQMVTSSSSTDLVPPNNLLWNIDRANRHFGQAGVQFTAWSSERIVMPSFNMLQDTMYQWSQVRAQLQLALPNIPSNAWGDGVTYTAEQWLTYAAARFAPDDYAIVWVPGSSGNSWAEFPWTGRSIVMSPSNFPAPQVTPFPSCGASMAVPTNNFTHELGHFLGLPHTWTLDGINPKTGAASTRSDYWDLVYCPASACGTDLFFDSASEAAAYEPALELIDRRYADPNKTIWPSSDTWCWAGGGTGDAVSCCPDCANGTISCKLPAPNGGFTTYSATHPGMKGMLYDYGPNVQQGISLIASNYNSEVGLSTSQKLQIRRALRYDLPLDAPVQNRLGLPAGTVATGRRHVLGTTFNREMANKLDFDGDGKRDIAVWQPPPSAWSTTKGTFLVLLSSQGYSAAQMLVRKLGVLGDTPVPADYDGDGKTDFAVFHPAFELTNGDWAYWSWCRSNLNHDCSALSVKTRQWGIKSDIPLPGLDFDGDPTTGELAIFRRSNGRFAWYNIATGATDYRDVGPGRVPLPGLYDTVDTKTDLVTWDPINATFEMRLASLDDYNSPLTRSFPNVKPSTDGGTASQRASGVPVALKYHALVGERRALAVYDPEGPPDGIWNTMWTPVSYTTLSTCNWGASMDVPLGGYLDLNGDLAGDYVVFRAQADADSYFHILPGSYACSGSSLSINVGVRNHAYPFIAADMDGDGKPELGLFEAATGWTFFFSGENFATAHAYALGDRAAVPL